MREYLKFYIGGQWVDPVELRVLDVENPATESVCGRIALGGCADVDRAVTAARAAFDGWSMSARADRLELLQTLLVEYQSRSADLAQAVTEEMGAPPALAAGPQVQMGLGHLVTAMDVLKNFSFDEARGATLVVKEPIGIVGYGTR